MTDIFRRHLPNRGRVGIQGDRVIQTAVGPARFPSSKSRFEDGSGQDARSCQVPVISEFFHPTIDAPQPFLQVSFFAQGAGVLEQDLTQNTPGGREVQIFSMPGGVPDRRPAKAARDKILNSASDTPAKDQALQQRIARESVRSMDPGRRNFPYCPKTWNPGITPQVDDDTSHGIVRGWGHRQEVPGRR